MANPPRNQPCPCGSGKKFKHCCIERIPAQQSGFPKSSPPSSGDPLALPQALQLAIQLHQGGHLHRAEAIYRQILQIQPNHADALHLLGLSQHQLGKHDLALTQIKKAVSLNPGSAHFHNNLGEVYRALNRPEEALACYDRAISLQPSFPEANRNIGLAHLAMGKAERAEAHLRGALAQFPEYLGIYWALGLALMSQGKGDEAVGLYNKGLEKNPADPALLSAKGIALRSTNKPEDAILHYQNAIGLQPRIPELHHNLALVYQQQGDTGRAIACLENELGLNPHAESARHLLAALQNTTTDRAPASYVRETFDGYADEFDEHLVGILEYQAPALLARMLQEAVVPSACCPLNVLDLGCGTGLFGEQVKDKKKRLVGIDLAPRMIEQARQRQIYDQLIVGDLLDYLSGAEASQFDLIAATDVFIYVGNLAPVFKHVSRILEPGGWFAFSIEAPQNETRDFNLDQTGRYQHHRDYLARLSVQFGFTQAVLSETCLRKEKGKPVAGQLYLLRKVH